MLVIDGKKKKPIIYDIALEDLKLIEDRILNIGSNYINRYERIIKIKSMQEIVDRVTLLSDLFELEEKYMFEKFNLIEAYYYLYENTTEALNAHKIGKVIIDLIYEQPEVDLQMPYFRNSYLAMI